MYDVIIIGGGSAALGAAIYSSRKALKTLIVTKMVSGQTAQAVGVENYPGFKKIDGIELVMKFRDQAENLGAEIIEGENVNVITKKDEKHFIVETNSNKYESRSIIIATGANPRKLNIPGEKELVGKGVAYCATCDAPIFKDKEVAVVGSGNSAMDAALELSKYARKIYLLSRSEGFKGDAKTLKRLKKEEKIQILTNANSTKITGEKFVEALFYLDSETKSEKKLDVSGIFVEIGWEVKTDCLPEGVKTNDRNEIVVDHKIQSTNIEGVYAAGDCTDSVYKQTIIAVAAGSKAAISVSEYLK